MSLGLLITALSLCVTLRSVGASLENVRLKCGEERELFPSGAPGEIPGMFGPEKWIKVNGETHVYNVTRPTIQRFCATGRSGTKKSAVVIAPGGGYRILAIHKEGSDVAKRFNKDGIDAFVLKYRVPARPANASLPKWWAPLQDAQRALGIIRSGADAMGINSSRIGFAGFSAGGHCEC